MPTSSKTFAMRLASSVGPRHTSAGESSILLWCLRSAAAMCRPLYAVLVGMALSLCMAEPWPGWANCSCNWIRSACQYILHRSPARWSKRSPQTYPTRSTRCSCDCSIRRKLPGYTADDLRAELRQLTGGDVELDVRPAEPVPTEAAVAEPDMGLFDTLSNILREADPGGIPMPYMLPAVTDGRFFSQLGIQTYGFLPMNLPEGFDFSRTIHAADERVPVEAMNFGTTAIYEALRRCGS